MESFLSLYMIIPLVTALLALRAAIVAQSTSRDS